MNLRHLIALAGFSCPRLTWAVNASCSQTITSGFPQASDVESLVNNEASKACVQLQTATGNSLVAAFQGYEFTANASAGSFDTGLCQDVLTDIAQQCILEGDFYGGSIISSSQAFNLSNTLYPGNAILSGLGASQTSTSFAGNPSSTQAQPGTLTSTSTLKGNTGTTTTGTSAQPSSSTLSYTGGTTSAGGLEPIGPLQPPQLPASTGYYTDSAGLVSPSGLSIYNPVHEYTNNPTLSSSDSLISGTITSSVSNPTATPGTSVGPSGPNSGGGVNPTITPVPTSVTASVSSTITDAAALASATQAAASASAAVTNLQNNPDSQTAKQAALDAINAAETAAKVAALAWLLSVLGPAATTAEAIVAGTEAVSSLVTAWAAVEAAQTQNDNEQASSSEEAEQQSATEAESASSATLPASVTSASTSASVSSSLTASASATASGSCSQYSYPPDDELGIEGTPDDGSGSDKRRRRSRTWRNEMDGEASRLGNYLVSRETDRSRRLDTHSILQKRDAGPFNGIGGCDFPPGLQAAQPGYSSKKGLINIGKQPGGNGGLNGQIFNAVPKWYVGEHSCNVPPGFQWYRSDTGTTIPVGSMQSVDHVWELNLINLFLATMISPSGSFDCTDMDTVFFPLNGPYCTTPENKMQTIFNQLPSMDPNNIQPGFIGLEQSVNGLKGFIFSQSLGSSGPFTNNRMKNFGTQLGAVQDAAMTFGVCTDSDVKHMFDVTNNRMYQAFQGVDELISNNALKRTDGSPIQANWADSYKSWMTGYLGTISDTTWTWASGLLSDMKAGATADQLTSLTNLESSPLWGQAAFQFDFDLSWNGGALSLRSLDKRQDDSCALSQASSELTVSTTLASQTPQALSSALTTAGLTSYLGSISSSLTTLTNVPPVTPQPTTTTPSQNPTSVTEPIYGPTESSSCAGGSSLCRSNPGMGSMCQTAFARYNDTTLYTAYSSLTYTNGANEAFTGDGCSAFFECSGAYPAGGVTGADIKEAFGLIGCSVCGWHDLSVAGCDVRLDACNDCVDWINGVDLEPVTPSDPEPWCNDSKC